MASRETLQKLLDAQTMLIDEIDDCEAELVSHHGEPFIRYKCRWLGLQAIRFEADIHNAGRFTISIGINGARGRATGTYWIADVTQAAALADGSYHVLALYSHMLLRRAQVSDAANGTKTWSELYKRRLE